MITLHLLDSANPKIGKSTEVDLEDLMYTVHMSPDCKSFILKPHLIEAIVENAFTKYYNGRDYTEDKQRIIDLFDELQTIVENTVTVDLNSYKVVFEIKDSPMGDMLMILFDFTLDRSIAPYDKRRITISFMKKEKWKKINLFLSGRSNQTSKPIENHHD